MALSAFFGLKIVLNCLAKVTMETQSQTFCTCYNSFFKNMDFFSSLFHSRGRILPHAEGRLRSI